ncbi:LysE family translocator [Bradyrhizobium sp. HKCCYLS1011]|uniref:LysE family translocator n=1 Tax=Bradyrhizobium sp. HKCCYLS1011 TaxID=3420733 RepID=UPI003EBBE104
MAFLTFLIASYSLLAVPGPTNTLLATSGAGVGVSRSLHLLAAELCGYLSAILLLRVVLNPIMTDIPLVGIVLRAGLTIYILGLACALWRSRSDELRQGVAVTFRHVLLTTLLNPKAIIFAFLLLPVQVAFIDLAPWLVMLALQIVTAGAAWLVLGATLGHGVRRLGRPEFVTRGGAIALVGVASLIWLPALAIS